MIGKKGLALPIEMIVIVAIAVLVLVVVAAFFIGGFGKTSSISASEALSRGCVTWKTTSANCATATSDISIQGYDPNGDGNPNTLSDACNSLGYTIDATCKQACVCP